MKTLEELLSRRWITVEKNKELFYKVHDEYLEYEDFLKDKLGYGTIFQNNFIKLDKYGVPPKIYMGITEFKSKMSYVFLCLILAFLENFDEEEQFILSELAEFITITFKEENIDWINRSDRSALVEALKFCVKEGIIRKNDGSEENYTNDSSAQVLYENTGLSKFVMRIFNQDISNLNSINDFENVGSMSENSNGETFLRHQVYRKLLMDIGVFNTPENEEEFKYIKRHKESIQDNFSKYFDANLHLHKNVAFLILGENSNFGRCFPNDTANSKITIECNIALLINSYIRKGIKEKKITVDFKDNIVLKKEQFNELIIEVRKKYNVAFTKDFRTISDDKFIANIIEYLKNLEMIVEDNENYIFNSIVGKIIGEYDEALLTEENND